MDNQKDELLSGAELGKRLGINRSYFTNNKNKLKDAGCTYGKKFYYRKTCDFLGKDPDNPYQSRQSEIQKEVKALKETTKDTDNLDYEDVLSGKDESQDVESEAKELLEQIVDAIKGGNDRGNRAKLDSLKLKAGVLREYFTAKNEEIKNRKLADNLFERDEVIQILSFAMNMIRNSLINMPNNYAVSLDGLDQKQIKEYVTDDVNKILEDLQNVGNQFE